MNDDRGFTLIELVVVVMLMGVLGAITTKVVVTGLHKQSDLQSRATSIDQVRVAMQRTTRDIRSADEIYSLTTTGLSMLTGTTYTCYQVTTSAGVTALVRRTSLVTGDAGCSSPASTRTVVSHLVNDSTAPVFASDLPMPTYTPASGSGVDGSTCIDGALPPITYAPKCVGSVKVEFVVRPVDSAGTTTCTHAAAGPSGCDITVTDSAELRNA